MTANPVLTPILERLVGGADLSAQDAAAALAEVMGGRASAAETAGFLVGLRAKGETVDEIVGLARTMREFAERVEVSAGELVDTAGTGGGRPSFNVSTTAAFVAAGAGCPVAKHGNRSATGRCGSADVLEALGARIDLDPGAVAECIEEVGFGFMFAPRHHPAMRHVAPVRAALAIRTVFNLLGPLTNPAGASRQLVGVADSSLVETIGRALAGLGLQHALVVCGEGGFDEISASGPTRAVEVRAGAVAELELDPASLGVEPVAADAFVGGSPEQNALIARQVLGGSEGPERSVTLLNAGAAIYVGGLAGTVAEGVAAAAETIDSGAATDVLDRFVEATLRLGSAEQPA